MGRLESFKLGDMIKLAFWKDTAWQLCEEWVGGERLEAGTLVERVWQKPRDNEGQAERTWNGGGCLAGCGNQQEVGSEKACGVEDSPGHLASQCTEVSFHPLPSFHFHPHRQPS